MFDPEKPFGLSCNDRRDIPSSLVDLIIFERRSLSSLYLLFRAELDPFPTSELDIPIELERARGGYENAGTL